MKPEAPFPALSSAPRLGLALSKALFGTSVEPGLQHFCRWPPGLYVLMSVSANHNKFIKSLEPTHHLQLNGTKVGVRMPSLRFVCHFFCFCPMGFSSCVPYSPHFNGIFMGQTFCKHGGGGGYQSDYVHVQEEGVVNSSLPPCGFPNRGRLLH